MRIQLLAAVAAAFLGAALAPSLAFADAPAGKPVDVFVQIPIGPLEDSINGPSVSVAVEQRGETPGAGLPDHIRVRTLMVNVSGPVIEDIHGGSPAVIPPSISVKFVGPID